ncbi:MAG: sodium:proton exchanger [Alphaproteobacteria bacterium]|nr:sodium:proton exchanger [Alphaproteobacteria bacterium]
MVNPHLLDVLANILLFFGIGALFVPLLQRLKISPVLGYLLCGIIIGPHGLGLFVDAHPWMKNITIRETDTVHLLGELGIMTLMFMIGLELSFHRLKELKKYIFGLGLAQILISALAIAVIARLFNNAPEVATVIGAAFALSSTAIVMKLLEERHLSNQPVGILCFSILLMQDLAVIPILVLTASFTGDDPAGVARAIITAIIVGIVTVTAILIVGRKLLGPLLHSATLARSPEWLAVFTVFMVVACAILTNIAGLSLALGAFLAGLLIAETEYRHEVEVIIAPLKGLLLGIFFLSVGMMIDIQEVLSHPVLLLVSVAGIYLVKITILFPLCLLFRIDARRAAKASIFLSQPGEFALLILGVAMSTRLMPVEDVQFFFLVTALAMAFSPVLFRFAPLAGNFAARIMGQREMPEALAPQEEEEAPRKVIIAGFGRVGQMIAQILEEQKIPYIAFDYDAALAKTMEEAGTPIICADARHIETWQKFCDEKIMAAVIAIDDFDAKVEVLASLHNNWPLLQVIMRCRDTVEMNTLYDKGADYVVAETQESSLRIAQVLLGKAGTGLTEAENIVSKIRRSEALTQS